MPERESNLMNLSDFSTLKEIQSLDKMIKSHQDRIFAEESRKDHIHRLREKRETEKVGLYQILRENAALISNLEEELSVLEKKKEDQFMVQEIERLTGEMDLVSEKIFNLMEENEELESKINDCKSFLEGSLETLKEIDSEIQEETANEQKEIINYQDRISSLLLQIPEELRRKFLKVRDKYQNNSPLSRIVNKACEKCRYEVDSQTMSLVDQAKIIQVCHQCDRLLIPFDA